MGASQPVRKPGLTTPVARLRGVRRRGEVGLTRAYGWLYSRSGGRIGGAVRGHRVLLLTTTGRRSGRRRRSPVQYEQIGDEMVLVAAAGGSPSPPAWWLNLEANAEVEVQVGRDVWPTRAETAGPDRRADLWAALVAATPYFASAETKAGRQLPVVVIPRRSGPT
jgi:deazaflavin-dependent oxidoreductase (nitroreductase family)